LVLRRVYNLSHAEITEILGASHIVIAKHVAKGLIQCPLGLLDAKERSADLRRISDGGQT